MITNLVTTIGLRGNTVHRKSICKSEAENLKCQVLSSNHTNPFTYSKEE